MCIKVSSPHFQSILCLFVFVGGGGYLIIGRHLAVYRYFNTMVNKRNINGELPPPQPTFQLVLSRQATLLPAR